MATHVRVDLNRGSRAGFPYDTRAIEQLTRLLGASSRTVQGALTSSTVSTWLPECRLSFPSYHFV